MRHRVVVVLVLMAALFFAPPITAFPSGIGNQADNGCLCHGVADTSTQVELNGLPQAWEANTTYTLNISISSTDETLANSSMGGFRLLISDGEVNYSRELVQLLEDGLTHTEKGSNGQQWQVNVAGSALSRPGVPLTHARRCSRSMGCPLARLVQITLWMEELP